MDPAAAGGDPAAAGGSIPPELMAALSGGSGSAPSPSQITMTVPDLISLIQALQAGGGAAKPKKPAAEGGASGGAAGGSDAKLDQIIQILSGNMMGGAAGGAGAPAPQGGGQPPQQ